jgi:hypothetical protein
VTDAPASLLTSDRDFDRRRVALAWFVFRYDRHGKQRDAIEAAHGLLRAVWHGMVQGLTPGQTMGWGQGYFTHDYRDADALERATQTHETVMERGMDQSSSCRRSRWQGWPPHRLRRD